MKSKTYRTAAWGLVSAVLTAAALAQNPASPVSPPGKLIIAVVPPQAQPGSAAADLGEPARQSLINQLQGAGFDVVPLESRDGPQVDAEAAVRHANYVLYTHVEQKHSSGLGGIGGMLHKLSPLASALPMMGAMGGRGGGLGSAVASTVAQGAAGATAAAAQQQASANTKSGDTVTIEYRLVAPGSTAALSSATLQGKASGDGEDVLSSLVGKLASSISSVAHPGAGPDASSAAPPPPAADAAQGKHSMLGGLFSHLGGAASKTTATAYNAGNGGIDCASIAANPNANMSRESCEKLMGAQQAYQRAAADPSAARAGDDQMTCEQIITELHAQSYTAPDQTRVAQGQALAAQQQSTAKRQIDEVQRTIAVQSAALAAAGATDRATEMATMGVVNPNREGALAETFEKQNKAMNERMVRESKPIAHGLMTSTADFAADAGQQLSANPRLARLVQLANAKHCKGS